MRFDPVQVIKDTLPLHSGSNNLGMEAPGCNLASTLFFALNCFVLTNAPPSSKDTEHDGETATSNDDATAHSVSRFLRAKEEIGAKPMRHARDAVGNGNERSTLYHVRDIGASGCRHVNPSTINDTFDDPHDPVGLSTSNVPEGLRKENILPHSPTHSNSSNSDPDIKPRQWPTRSIYYHQQHLNLPYDKSPSI